MNTIDSLISVAISSIDNLILKTEAAALNGDIHN